MGETSEPKPSFTPLPSQHGTPFGVVEVKRPMTPLFGVVSICLALVALGVFGCALAIGKEQIDHLNNREATRVEPAVLLTAFGLYLLALVLALAGKVTGLASSVLAAVKRSMPAVVVGVFVTILNGGVLMTIVISMQFVRFYMKR